VSRLISTSTMTVDGVTDVGAWYVAEGGHDRAARDQFDGAAGMLLGRKTYDGLAGYWPEQRRVGGPAQPAAEVRRLADAPGAARMERHAPRRGRLGRRLTAEGGAGRRPAPHRLRRAGAAPARAGARRRAPVLAPSRRRGDGCTSVRGVPSSDAAARVDVVRLRGDATPLRPRRVGARLASPSIASSP
jgi:hypothetical protein